MVTEKSLANIVIRPAQEEDAESFRDLRLEGLKKHPEAFASDYEHDVQYPIEHWRDRVRPDPEDNSVIYVAQADQTLVGITGIYRASNSKMRHNGHIWGVYVRPAWRGSGLADRIIGACVEWARVHQIRHVKLCVSATNPGAIRCYLRCGFSVYGIEPEVIYANCIFYDELLMAKSLRQ